ncbi:AraC family transcriptional regulator [Niabella sp.]|uniref:helix-turn-helix domain-containing protein n=1 Tax=Niabella sp. TaxID=1962976 RepID=UPI00260CB64E|nr:AraC family transcriptional regulator [Niabella sp.]
MAHTIKMISNYEYKRQFLPEISANVLHDHSQLQLYKIESYLKDILIPVPPYRTSFNFLMLVTKGYIQQQLETQSYTVTAGQVINIKQGCITRTLELSPDLQGFYLIYENNVITSFFLNNKELDFFFTAPYIQLSAKEVKWLEKSFYLLKEELDTITHNGSEDICLALFSAILLKLIKSGNPDAHALTRDLKISYQFRTEVQHAHIQHKDVSFYAKKMQISETYLNKCVKKTTGKPPKQWIQEISILHSQILLQNLTKEISEVAYELNYQSASYFTRIFHKVTGVTPKTYRLQLKERYKNNWV